MIVEIEKLCGDREQLLHQLARENIVPVKAPEWAHHPFELRRNEKTKRGQIGQHLFSTGVTSLVIEYLGITDEQSCKAVRERIKRLRKNFGYK